MTTKSDFPILNQDAVIPRMARQPRVLVLDRTLVGDGSATGELKATLFKDWPADQFAQVYHRGHDNFGFYREGIITPFDADVPGSRDMLRTAIAEFAPDIVLYRPAPALSGPQAQANAIAKKPNTDQFELFCIGCLQTSETPYLVWIVDDWPAAFAEADPVAAAEFDAGFRSMLDGAQRCMSIDEQMSQVFAQRYGKEFIPVANGVNPADWPAITVRENPDPFRIRYAGSLAENMTMGTLRLFGQAVDRLAKQGRPILFEVKTRAMWRDSALAAFAGIDHVRNVTGEWTAEEYRAWLREADALVIAYNFDETSSTYVQHSRANKLPEYLASGVPVIGVGPANFATIGHLEENECGLTVTENSVVKIAAAIDQLIDSLEQRRTFAEKGREVAFSRFNVADQRARLVDLILGGVRFDSDDGFERSAHASVDETEVIADLLAGRTGRDRIMLDVGAHFGSSASYFHELGWSIYCFEPDARNREKLDARFGGAENVTIDSRGVSDTIAVGVPFYSSVESTGISGLSAFHDTHEQSGTVDVTTVTKIVSELSIRRIDFLKIDVEGFDFSVLKGVPWDELKPDVIECEFEDAKTVPLGHGWREVADYLIARGYTVYVSEWHPIIRYGVRHDWRCVTLYSGAEPFPDAWGNLLAFLEDPGVDAVQGAFQLCLKFGGTSPLSGVKVKDMPTVHDQLIALASKKESLYISLAHGLHRFSPRAYRVALLGFHALRHVWQRRIWTIPAVVAIMAIAYGITRPL